MILFFLLVKMKNKLESAVTFHYQDCRGLICVFVLASSATGFEKIPFSDRATAWNISATFILSTPGNYWYALLCYYLAIYHFICKIFFVMKSNTGTELGDDTNNFASKQSCFFIIYVQDPSGMYCIIFLSCQILSEFCTFIQSLLSMGAYISHFKRNTFFQIPKNNF